MAMKLYSDSSVQAIANAIRSKNGESTQYKIADMAQAILDIPSGGGGDSSPWKHLETITVAEDTRAVDINISEYFSQYDALWCYGDVTLSAADWLYIVPNGSSPTGGSYTNGQRLNPKGVVFDMRQVFGSTGEKKCNYFAQGNGAWTSGTVTNFYIYTYTSSKKIKAGSTFYIYGVNYADL